MDGIKIIWYIIDRTKKEGAADAVRVNFMNKNEMMAYGIARALSNSYSIYMGPKYEKSVLLKYWERYQTRAGVARIRKNNKAAGSYERHGFKKL